MNTQVKFRLRFYRDAVIAIGPGKVELLEAIASAGSISGAARQLGMSYRRAWLLLEELNTSLTSPAVVTATGGARGGGASLTEVGQAVIAHYRAIEDKASKAAAQDIHVLTQLLAG
ncbi:LysR family transcriptional regulator [Lampropedia puyangensis]|uniref:LysR family transcriptional regulator n=1 Tax=Lampropedia puyangensis TaxID=1330072 RepID=A0A4S8FC16_9BURK|nr:LysR family transcriptional regulator [Lampropedia puyangensis]THU04551.1 LysR family transcriptional regulator [Lampropedia puyangensis]